MLTSIEYGYLVGKLRDKLNATMVPGVDRLQLLTECQSLLMTLQKAARPLRWFIDHYPYLTFGDTGSGIEVRADASFTRAEAIDLRNQLVADGLSVFRLFYGPQGAFVEPLIETPEAGALESMQRAYGDDWKVWRAPNGTYNFVLKTSLLQEAAEQLAGSFADRLKELYPWGWLVVRVPVIDEAGGSQPEVRTVRK